MTRNSVKVRDARLEELDEVSLAIRDAYVEYEKVMPPEVWKEYLASITDVRSRLGVAELIIAEVDGKVAGAVTLYLDASRTGQDTWPDDGAAVRILAVHPKYRGRGLGRKLMEEALQRCRAQGIRTVSLHTTEFMAIGRAMYERMGFKRAPEFDFYPRPGRVVMAYKMDL